MELLKIAEEIGNLTVGSKDVKFFTVANRAYYAVLNELAKRWGISGHLHSEVQSEMQERIGDPKIRRKFTLLKGIREYGDYFYFRGLGVDDYFDYYRDRGKPHTKEMREALRHAVTIRDWRQVLLLAKMLLEEAP